MVHPTNCSRARAGLALAVGILAVAAPIGAEAGIRIVAPRHLATALGETTIEIEPSAPPGDAIARVEIFVDGVLLESRNAPPWTVTWDAGDGSRGHRIEAVLHLASGLRESVATRTSPLRINQTLEVDLVSLYPIVLDRAGRYVSGLTRDDFEILEDGVPQPIERFSTEHRALRVAIVLDTSLSMSKQNRLEQAQRAALGFLEVLQPQDEGLVVAFSDRVNLVQDITSDRTALASAISSSIAEGGTALYDAIWRSAKRLTEFDGRRVMVLLSDGRDEAANGFEPGSLHTLAEATTQALRSEVMVFAIGLGRNLDLELAREWTRPIDPDPRTLGTSLQQILASIADATGGRLLLSPSGGKLRKAFNEVADDLRNQYSIAFSPREESKDGSFHRLEVRVPGRDVEVVARKGYYAGTSADEPTP